MPIYSFNFHGRRNKDVWTIIETGKYIFHIESSVSINSGLKNIIDTADKRFENIADILGVDYKSTKANEKFQKYNSWIHSDELIIEHDQKYSSEERKLKTSVTGTANSSGVNIVVRDSDWKNHERMVLHEETHLIWMNEAGEAPSILNEGIAVYVECLISDGHDSFKENMSKIWQENIGSDEELLKKLTLNQYFWSNHSNVSVYYDLGSILVWYIVNTWGISVLKDIFMRTYYDDEKLAEIIEIKTSSSVNEIQNAITALLI